MTQSGHGAARLRAARHHVLEAIQGAFRSLLELGKQEERSNEVFFNTKNLSRLSITSIQAGIADIALRHTSLANAAVGFWFDEANRCASEWTRKLEFKKYASRYQT
jgi:hypothetical protein